MNRLLDNPLRHIAQNAAMALPVVRRLARRWHRTGMVGDPERILPVLGRLLAMTRLAKARIDDRVVVELGPGQTPELLYCAVCLGAARAIGLDVTEYVAEDVDHDGAVRRARMWLADSIAQGRLDGVESLAPMPDGPAPVGVRHYDGVRFPLDDESVDVVWSKSVLEHVHRPSVLLEETLRVLVPGGTACHVIDLRDHYTMSTGEDWLRFLRYPQWYWSLISSNRSSWCNRIREPEWRAIFASHGFEIVGWEVEDRPLHETFDRTRLDGEFRDLPDEVLRAAWLHVTCRKPDRR